MLMKTGSKSAWWLSKCCWMVCTVTISFAALILTGVTLCPMFHYTVRFSGIYVLAAPFCAVLSVSLIGKSGGDTDFAFRLRYTCTICGFAVVYLGSQYANTIL